MKSKVFIAFLLCYLLAFVAIAPGFAMAQDDADEDVEVTSEEVDDDVPVAEDEEATEETEEEKPIGPNGSVMLSLLFSEYPKTDFPAGEIVETLIGVKNDGDVDIIVTDVEGSFRYPQDFKYYIQNFTKFDYNQTVPAKAQSTLKYLFRTDPNYDPRSFGLIINVNYVDVNDNPFTDEAYNGTVTVVESLEGFDAQTFFLYVALAAVVALVVFSLSGYVSGNKTTKRNTRSAPAVERGTSQSVDSEWLPEDVRKRATAKAAKRN